MTFIHAWDVIDYRYHGTTLKILNMHQNASTEVKDEMWIDQGNAKKAKKYFPGTDIEIDCIR